MKINKLRKIVVLIGITSLTSTLLSACNGGHASNSNSTLSAKNNLASETANQSAVNTLKALTPSSLQASGDINDSIINSWFQKIISTPASPTASIATTISTDSQGLGIVAQIRGGVRDLVTEGVQGMVLDFLMGQIFPPQKSAEMVTLEEILKVVNSVADKVNELSKVTSDMYSYVSAQFLSQYSAQLYSNISAVNNFNGLLKSVLGKVTYENENYGNLYSDGKLDFKVDSGHTTENGEIIYKTNDKLIKILLYLASQKKATMDSLFKENSMSSLDEILQEITNLSDADAYSDGVQSKATTKLKILKGSNLNIQLLPQMVNALGANIVADATGQTQQFALATDLREIKGKNLDSAKNRLVSYLIMDSQVKKLEANTLQSVYTIQTLQNYSIVLRYLGGDSSIAVPNYINVMFADLESDAQEQEKIANDKSLSETERSDAANNAAQIRQQIFDEATNMIAKSFAKRIKHVDTVLNEPANYSKDLRISIETKDNTTELLPSYDLIRGLGIYSPNHKTLISSIATESQPYYNIKGKLISVSDLIKANDIYWDGYNASTLSLDPAATGSVLPKLVQDLGHTCTLDEHGNYNVTITNLPLKDVEDPGNYPRIASLNCSADFINPNDITNATPSAFHVSGSNNTAHKIFLFNDGNTSTSKTAPTAKVLTLPYFRFPMKFSAGLDFAYVKNNYTGEINKETINGILTYDKEVNVHMGRTASGMGRGNTFSTDGVFSQYTLSDDKLSKDAQYIFPIASERFNTFLIVNHGNQDEYALGYLAHDYNYKPISGASGQLYDDDGTLHAGDAITFFGSNLNELRFSWHVNEFTDKKNFFGFNLLNDTSDFETFFGYSAQMNTTNNSFSSNDVAIYPTTIAANNTSIYNTSRSTYSNAAMKITDIATKSQSAIENKK